MYPQQPQSPTAWGFLVLQAELVRGGSRVELGLAIEWSVTAMAKSHVTQREADAVVRYASQLCQALHMPGWRILVMEAAAEDDAHASVKWIDQRHVAQIYLGEGWMKVDYNERREIVTHEVLHLLHSKVSTVVIDDSADFMREHDHDDWTRRVGREFELMVDYLAMWMADTHSLVEAWDEAHAR